MLEGWTGRQEELMYRLMHCRTTKLWREKRFRVKTLKRKERKETDGTVKRKRKYSVLIMDHIFRKSKLCKTFLFQTFGTNTTCRLVYRIKDRNKKKRTKISVRRRRPLFINQKSCSSSGGHQMSQENHNK